MSARSKRTVRTVLQLVVGLASVVPDLVASVPLGAAGVQAVLVAGVVTHWFHVIEAIPGFPASLKLDG